MSNHLISLIFDASLFLTCLYLFFLLFNYRIIINLCFRNWGESPVYPFKKFHFFLKILNIFKMIPGNLIHCTYNLGVVILWSISQADTISVFVIILDWKSIQFIRMDIIIYIHGRKYRQGLIVHNYSLGNSWFLWKLS